MGYLWGELWDINMHDSKKIYFQIEYISDFILFKKWVNGQGYFFLVKNFIDFRF